MTTLGFFFQKTIALTFGLLPASSPLSLTFEEGFSEEVGFER